MGHMCLLVPGICAHLLIVVELAVSQSEEGCQREEITQSHP